MSVLAHEEMLREAWDWLVAQGYSEHDLAQLPFFAAVSGGAAHPPADKKKRCACGRTSPGGCEVRGCYFPASSSAADKETNQ